VKCHKFTQHAAVVTELRENDLEVEFNNTRLVFKAAALQILSLSNNL